MRMRIILFKSHRADMNVRHINPYEILLMLLLTLLFYNFWQKWDIISEYKVKYKEWKNKTVRKEHLMNAPGKCVLFFNLGLEVYTMLNFYDSIVKCMLGKKTLFWKEKIHKFFRLVESKYHYMTAESWGGSNTI